MLYHSHHRRFADRDQLPKQQQLLTTIAYVSELQRDWACPTADDVAKLFAEHGGGFGQGLRWEWQLLGLKEGTR